MSQRYEELGWRDRAVVLSEVTRKAECCVRTRVYVKAPMEQAPLASAGCCDWPGLRGARCWGRLWWGVMERKLQQRLRLTGPWVSHHLQPHSHRHQTVPVLPWASGSASSRSLASALSSTVWPPSTEVRVKPEIRDIVLRTWLASGGRGMDFVFFSGCCKAERGFLFF